MSKLTKSEIFCIDAIFSLAGLPMTPQTNIVYYHPNGLMVAGSVITLVAGIF